MCVVTCQQDLFPGVELPPMNYDRLLGAMDLQAKHRKLQPVKPFLDKAIQLYEMIVVRHGIMLVGHSFGPKTSVYQVLAAAIGTINITTNYHIINPKALAIGKLYGMFDAVSHEWTDGILALTFRKCARNASRSREWIVFDGPVDAVRKALRIWGLPVPL